ncbi:MAG: type II secretion system GspH family protein, partial [Phycisphaerales bacterium]|nr:type II secretion system GspH family protein [Phycisphaerales bacterium]
MQVHPPQAELKNGFTLIEILLVVVILAILAVIVVPQYSDAAGNARMIAMRSQLVSMRGQIGAWRVRHDQAIPGGASGGIADVWQALEANGQLSRAPELFPGFTWAWEPATAQLSLAYDAT